MQKAKVKGKSAFKSRGKSKRAKQKAKQRAKQREQKAKQRANQNGFGFDWFFSCFPDGFAHFSCGLSVVVSCQAHRQSPKAILLNLLEFLSLISLENISLAMNAYHRCPVCESLLCFILFVSQAIRQVSPAQLRSHSDHRQRLLLRNGTQKSDEDQRHVQESQNNVRASTLSKEKACRSQGSDEHRLPHQFHGYRQRGKLVRDGGTRA